MLGFKHFHSASATFDGIETAHMIRKGQFDDNGMNAFQQLASSQHNYVQRKPVLNSSENLRQIRQQFLSSGRWNPRV